MSGNELGTSGAEVLAKESLPPLINLKALHLTDCGIGPAAMKAFAPGLARLAGLETLQLRGNEIGVAGVQALVQEALPHLGGLRELVLAHCELKPASIQELAPGLRYLSRLEKLVLAFNEIGAGGAQALATESLPHIGCLRELNLCSCGLDADAVQALAPGLGQLLRLERLVLTSNEMDAEGAAALCAEVFPRCTGLKELDIAHCSLEQATLQSLGPSLRVALGLQRLVLMGNDLGVGGARELATDALPSCLKLKELNISYAKLNGAALKEIVVGLRYLAELEILNIRNNKFGMEGALALVEEALPSLSSLQVLDLRLCGLDTEMVKDLAPRISQVCSLKTLELGDKKLLASFIMGLSRCGSGDGELESQFGMFREIGLDRASLTADSMKEVASGLRHFSDLEVLSIRGSEIGLDGARALAAVLPRLAKLKQLHLSSCGFGADAIQELTPSIGHLLDLETLNLMGNEMGSEGALSLVDAVLPRLGRLREFNVMGCAVSGEAMASMDEAVGPGRKVMT